MRTAVKSRRKLAYINLGEYKADLASSLHDMSYYFHELKLFEDAVPPMEEAIEFRKALVRNDPEKYSARLSSSLYNLGFYFSKNKIFDDSKKPSH